MDKDELVSEKELNQIIEALAEKITYEMTPNTVFIGLDLQKKILANRIVSHCQKDH